MNTIEKYTNEIIMLCKLYKVKSLYVFGSVLTKDFNNESDVDFIVDFSNMEVEKYIYNPETIKINNNENI